MVVSKSKAQCRNFVFFALCAFNVRDGFVCACVCVCKDCVASKCRYDCLRGVCMTEEPVIYVTVIVFVMSEVAVFCCCLLNVRRGDCTFKGIWYHLVETESGLSNFEFYEKLISDVCDCNCIVGLTDVLCFVSGCVNHSQLDWTSSFSQRLLGYS